MRRVLIYLLASLFLLAGCYTKQVRHLASDAALIKPGKSTRQDVLRYLGEPNGHRMVSPGVEEYVYYEDQKGSLGKMPLVGDWVDPDGYEMILVTLNGDLVSSCEFRVFNEDDQDWVDDFTWEEVK
jgi:hypothetical protein